MTVDAELREALDDLQHDLGKHARLPLAMLPRDAGPEAVRAAVETGLLRTRRSAAGETSARALWAAFVAGHEEALAPYPERAEIEAALEGAHRWLSAHDVDRDAAERDLAAIAAALRGLAQAVQRG